MAERIELDFDIQATLSLSYTVLESNLDVSKNKDTYHWRT